MNSPVPFPDAPVAEVQLSRAPLEKVVVEVRFNPVLSIANPEYVAGFQEELRELYPELRQRKGVTITIEANEEEGALPTRSKSWQLTDRTGDWQVGLSTTAVTLVTTKYTSRADFVARFTRVMNAFYDSIGQIEPTRVGLRYVDRVVGEPLGRLKSLVRSELLGVLGLPSLGNAECTQAISSAVFARRDGVEAHARWGWLPPNTTFDLFVPPLNEPSWVLDVDFFRSNMKETIISEALAPLVTELAEGVYALFRWAVTPEFLTEYGATDP